MGLVLLITGLTLVFAVLFKILDHSMSYWFGSMLCGFSTGILGTVLVVVLIFIPIFRNASVANVAAFKARATTIQEQRANASEYERVMLTKEIVDDNAWLMSTQYYATNSWISIYYDKSVLDLKPIK